MNSDLLAYIGAITGAIGALTGIAGAWIAYIALQKTEQLKSQDLQLELGKALAKLENDLTSLPELLATAAKSRERISAARGLFNSGPMIKWKEGLTNDQTHLQGFNETFVRLNSSSEAQSVAHLQNRLFDVDRLQTSVFDLRRKYQASLAEDDKQRDHLREDQRAYMQTRIQGKP
jgi:hypothetical protein